VIYMGEATYYLKANNCTEEALENIRKFILEACEAQDYWQDNRDMEVAGKRKEFWSKFGKKFPLTSKYLKQTKSYDNKILYGGDCNNDLAGYLDFGDKEDAEDNLELYDEQLLYNAYVWHFANWDGFADFLKSEFGLTKVRWISDEYMNPFDVL